MMACDSDPTFEGDRPLEGVGTEGEIVSAWTQEMVSSGRVDFDEADRSCQLLQTVEKLSFCSAPSNLWIFPEDYVSAVDGGVVGGETDPAEGELKAEGDPGAGALFLSHAWDGPPGFDDYFGGGQVFADVKQIQASVAVEEAVRRGLHQQPEPRVWVDRVSLPSPVSPTDHPLEQTVFGPYRLPVREIKAIFERVDGPNRGYTVLCVKDKEGHNFEGVMNMRTFDGNGRPSKDTSPCEVTWRIAAGWYHVSTAQVIPEDKVSLEFAESKRPFAPRAEQLRRWCTELGLRDEVWVEMTLGSLRCEYMLLAEPMLVLHSGFVALLTWNYFDRLWPLVEWAVFCAHHGAERVQLAATALAGPVLVEYYRAITRVSFVDACCRDPRDRQLLLQLIERIFVCKAETETLGYSVPPVPSCITCKCKACVCWTKDPLEKYHAQAAARVPAFTAMSTLSLGDRSVELGKVPLPVRDKVVDYSRAERFVRVTAIAVFAREAAMAASGRRGYDDEGGWMNLAMDLKLNDLHDALKGFKPYDCFRFVQQQEGLHGPEAEVSYLQKVEDWWTQRVLPVLAKERRRAVYASRHTSQ
eukprot:TRINITY_DN24997_c0_g1_i1.p1 TRINITY_DN24997_c0_g1~~TRINITY_DN24997_c0_g1_i1.p1  ORF type:complete len:607 (+),score=81.36 TRINITY_DN24997_c0_g1_i1:75-1823(+)